MGVLKTLNERFRRRVQALLFEWIHLLSRRILFSVQHNQNQKSCVNLRVAAHQFVPRTGSLVWGNNSNVVKIAYLFAVQLVQQKQNRSK